MVHTFVCQIVNEVDVITANRCPVLEIFSDSRASFPAELDIDVSYPSCREERCRCVSCSRGCMPGVMGVAGVDIPEGVSFSSSNSEPLLGASTSEPLPSVVSRDSASSSDLRTRSLRGFLLLAAYTLGAPIGQYILRTTTVCLRREVSCRRTGSRVAHHGSWGRV